MIGRRKTAFETVDQLLSVQNQALLDGDIMTLGKIEPPLERALNLLKVEKAQEGELAKIREKATRNATLLSAAQKGIAMARAQLSARASVDLATYDANGQTQVTSSGVPSFQTKR